MSESQTALDAVADVLVDSPNWGSDEWALDLLSALGIPPDAPLPLRLAGPASEAQVEHGARAVWEYFYEIPWEHAGAMAQREYADAFRAGLAAAEGVGDA